ncbi:MAG: coenzyme F420-0:L-glutamate ligase, partial [Patescibacteria group bacterium]
PKDSYRTASVLRKKLQQKFKVKHLGVLISDSGLLPLRAGVISLALGYAGFHGVKDYRNKPDIFGRKFVFSSTNIADGLATAATLVMGEGSEQQSLAIIKNPPIEFCEKVNRREMHINIEDDMFGRLFPKL